MSNVVYINGFKIHLDDFWYVVVECHETGELRLAIIDDVKEELSDYTDGDCPRSESRVCYEESSPYEPWKSGDTFQRRSAHVIADYPSERDMCRLRQAAKLPVLQTSKSLDPYTDGPVVRNIAVQISEATSQDKDRAEDWIWGLLCEIALHAESTKQEEPPF